MVAREEVVAETANVEGLIPVPIPVPVPVLVPVLVLAARREAEEDLRDTTTSTIATAAILITETTITTTTSVEEETATTVEWTAAAATAVPARRRQTTETSSTSLPSRVNEVSRLPRGLPARRARKKASSVKLNRLPRNALDEESASPNFFSCNAAVFVRRANTARLYQSPPNEHTLFLASIKGRRRRRVHIQRKRPPRDRDRSRRRRSFFPSL